MTIEIGVADLESSEIADAVLALLDNYATDIMGGGEELSEYTRAHLVDELRRRNSCCVILARVDGSPAGMAICFEGFSTFACQPILNIHDLVVAPRFRGHGLSQSMLAKIEQEAIRRSCCKLTLEVLEGNEVARNAYQKYGFEGYELDPKMGRALFYEKKLN